MSTKVGVQLCVVLCLFVIASAAQAITVYNNFGQGSGGFEYNTEESWFIAGFYSGFDYVEQAGAFTPSESGALSDLYLGLGVVLLQNETTIKLAPNNGTPPSDEDLLETWIVTDLPFLYSGDNVHLVSQNQPYLTAGESYWIWIAVDQGSSAGWGQNVTGATGPIVQRCYSAYQGGLYWEDIIPSETLGALRIDVSGGQSFENATWAQIKTTF